MKKNQNNLIQQKSKQLLMVIVRQIRILEIIENTPDWEWFKLMKYNYVDNEIYIECCGVKE